MDWQIWVSTLETTEGQRRMADDAEELDNCPDMVAGDTRRQDNHLDIRRRHVV